MDIDIHKALGQSAKVTGPYQRQIVTYTKREMEAFALGYYYGRRFGGHNVQTDQFTDGEFEQFSFGYHQGRTDYARCDVDECGRKLSDDELLEGVE